MQIVFLLGCIQLQVLNIVMGVGVDTSNISFTVWLRFWFKNFYSKFIIILIDIQYIKLARLCYLLVAKP